MTRIHIGTCIFERPLAKRRQWGDYWVKEELAKEFRNLGLTVVDSAPDVIVYLFGTPVRGTPRAPCIAWVYSHPAKVNATNLKKFYKIFSLSQSFTEKLTAMGYEGVETMIGATSKKPLDCEIERDMVFVGNIRTRTGRKVVDFVGDVPYDFEIWGRGWQYKAIPQRYFAGNYYDYENLDELYASSRISLNDHHGDMAREGFVAVKIFDILASGGFAISDQNAGLESIFGDAVPQYQSARHLRYLLDYYIANDDARRKLAEKGRRIALTHTWKQRAERFVKAFGL